MGFGERIGEKLLTNPGQEFLSYAMGKVMPGQRKLKTDYIGGKTLNKLQDWTARHLSKNRGSDFETYDYAPWEYNYGKESGERVAPTPENVGLGPQATDTSLGTMNTIGGSKLVKDKHGNVFSYDDYIFGNRGGKSEMNTGGLLKKFFGNKNTATLENLAQNTLGTNEGGTQYGGYRGENPGAQPVLQRVGDVESLSQRVNPDTGQPYNVQGGAIEGLDDIQQYVPDFYEKGYYDEEGKKRNLLQRAMSKQTAWYPGKLAGQVIGSIKDRFSGGMGHPDDLSDEEFNAQLPERLQGQDSPLAGAMGGQARDLARSIDPNNPDSVMAFQKATGLQADGRFGPQTLAKLREIQGQ